MPGGWTMSMTWMLMPGQTWPGAAASFLVMWVVMMVAMMLPSLVPMLWRYRQTVVGRRSEASLGGLTALVGFGYFFVWTAFGVAAFLLGGALATVVMKLPALARAVPMAIGVVVLVTGAIQFTAWKAHHLACCRKVPGRCHALPADAGTAWRHGVRLGLHCSYCCVGLTAILLVIGSHGPARDGCRDGSHHRRTSCTGWRACRASHRSRRRWGRVAADRASRGDRMMLTRSKDPTPALLRSPTARLGIHARSLSPAHVSRR